MERLTNTGTNGEIWITDNDETRRIGKKEAAYKKLKAYEDAEEQGRSLQLPYPLGTQLIYFVDDKDMEIYELDAWKIEVSKTPVSQKVLYTIDCFGFLLEDFGKIVFLTREEAEAKLKEMWKIKITYKDKSSCTLTGSHKEIPLELAVNYFNKYVANRIIYSARYQQYPKKDYSEMDLLEKIEELWEREGKR